MKSVFFCLLLYFLIDTQHKNWSQNENWNKIPIGKMTILIALNSHSWQSKGQQIKKIEIETTQSEKKIKDSISNSLDFLLFVSIGNAFMP